MTIAGLRIDGSSGGSRWLLFGSLALNLFFIGIGGALLVQDSGLGPAAPVAFDRGVAARIDRLAAALPSDDGKLLRAAYTAHRADIDGSRAAYRKAQDATRAVLRVEPFDGTALRRAMAAMRDAKLAFDRKLQNLIAQVAADMSPTGRRKLADYHPPSRTVPAQGR